MSTHAPLRVRVRSGILEMSSYFLTGVDAFRSRFRAPFNDVWTRRIMQYVLFLVVSFEIYVYVDINLVVFELLVICCVARAG